MAVYTHLSQQDINFVLDQFPVGSLIDFQAILDGVTNSHYKISTTQGCYVLRIYEERPLKEIEFEINLLSHLEKKRFPAPSPVTTKSGQNWLFFQDHYLVLFHFLEGEQATQTKPVYMAQLGEYLAKFHLAAKDFPSNRENPFCLSRLQKLLDELKARKIKEIVPVIKKIEKDLDDLTAQPLSRSVEKAIVHGDLFMDNVKFDPQDKLIAFLDFEFACFDYWIWDIATTINAWAFVKDQYCQESIQIFLQNYQKIRPISSYEIDAFYNQICLSAIRFMITRLYHQYIICQDSHSMIVVTKDYKDYLKRLEFLQAKGKDLVNNWGYDHRLGH